MLKFYTIKLLAVLIVAVFCCQPSWAKEDTAQITLEKTAVSKQNVHLYRVKKGDVISAIIRKLPGITVDDIPDNYRVIKELNPEIENLNKLYAGQVIKLPGKSVKSEKEDQEKSSAVSDSTAPAAPEGAQTYKIRKGDTLITIIR